MGTAGHTVVSAGLIVAVALGAMAVIDGHVFHEIAFAAALVVAWAVTASLTLLPALLVLLGSAPQRCRAPASSLPPERGRRVRVLGQVGGLCAQASPVVGAGRPLPARGRCAAGRVPATGPRPRAAGAGGRAVRPWPANGGCILRERGDRAGPDRLVHPREPARHGRPRGAGPVRRRPASRRQGQRRRVPDGPVGGEGDRRLHRGASRHRLRPSRRRTSVAQLGRSGRWLAPAR